MTPPKARRPGRAVRRAEARTPARRRPRVAWLAALAGAGALALWLAFAPRAPRPSDPVAVLDPVQAYARALELSQASRYIESVPYFQRALTIPGGVAVPVLNSYTAALHNAVLQSRKVGRWGRRTTRSSVERVTLTSEWLRHLDLLDAGAATASRRAFLLEVRSSTLAMWGFPLEAMEAHRRARALDPGIGAAPPEEP